MLACKYLLYKGMSLTLISVGSLMFNLVCLCAAMPTSNASATSGHMNLGITISIVVAVVCFVLAVVGVSVAVSSLLISRCRPHSFCLAAVMQKVPLKEGHVEPWADANY